MKPFISLRAWTVLRYDFHFTLRFLGALVIAASAGSLSAESMVEMDSKLVPPTPEPVEYVPIIKAHRLYVDAVGQLGVVDGFNVDLSESGFPREEFILCPPA
jgi:hypothetical protein